MTAKGVNDLVISPEFLFTLTLTMGYEYWLKQCWDSLRAEISKMTLGYFLYRLIHWFLFAATGWLLSRDISFQEWLAFSLVCVLVGCLELPVYLIIKRVRERTGFSVYELNYVVPVALAVVSSWMRCSPRFDVDYRLAFLIVFLSHPANYLIRWALERSDSALKRLSATDGGTAIAQVAATGDSGRDAREDRLKVGRKIGTIERWLIVLLMATDNIASIGLVITAKSIVRYPQLSDRDFAEYYLFGTLLSVVLALASGLVVLGGV